MGAKNSKRAGKKDADDADSGPDEAPLDLPEVPELEQPAEPLVSIEDMRATWLALGSEKWREVIDGRHENLGPLVYDECLHNQNFGKKEIGFLNSMQAAWEFIGDHCLGKRTTLAMWLEVHALCMRHLGDSGLGGVMRNRERSNFVEVPPCWPNKPEGITPDAVREIEAEATYCELQRNPNVAGGKLLVFLPMKRKRRARIFNHHLAKFYAETAHPETMTPWDKIVACGRLQQAMQRLEPSKDGNQRTSCLFLNKHLTELGLHPSILYWPNGADIYSLEEWARNVEIGLKEWTRIRNGLPPMLKGCADDATTREAYKDLPL